LKKFKKSNLELVPTKDVVGGKKWKKRFFPKKKGGTPHKNRGWGGWLGFLFYFFFLCFQTRRTTQKPPPHNPHFVKGFFGETLYRKTTPGEKKSF